MLDEPLSALDGVIKEVIKDKIREIAKVYHLSILIVTHDPEEAMTISNHVVIINEGKIEQYGTPHQILKNPSSSFIKEFILNQLEIKRDNIYRLFQQENA